MTACGPISLQTSRQVFGLPATFCKLCPQYNHVIIFPRRCYNEMQCPLPVFFYKMKTRARKGGLFKLDPKGTDEIKQWNNLTRPGESVPSAGSKCLPPLDSHNFPVLIHRMKTAEAAVRPFVVRTTQAQPCPNTPDIPPRRPAPNFLHRLIDRIISRSMYARGFHKVHYGTTTVWEKSR